jgi:hypothetical protein
LPGSFRAPRLCCDPDPAGMPRPPPLPGAASLPDSGALAGPAARLPEENADLLAEVRAVRRPVVVPALLVAADDADDRVCPVAGAVAGDPRPAAGPVPEVPAVELPLPGPEPEALRLAPDWLVAGVVVADGLDGLVVRAAGTEREAAGAGLDARAAWAAHGEERDV